MADLPLFSAMHFRHYTKSRGQTFFSNLQEGYLQFIYLLKYRSILGYIQLIKIYKHASYRYSTVSYLHSTELYVLEYNCMCFTYRQAKQNIELYKQFKHQILIHKRSSAFEKKKRKISAFQILLCFKMSKYKKSVVVLVRSVYKGHLIFQEQFS